mmetsp:Transcript_5147/g.11415  ORF Transcript_5147/g.11415 Transcript_5147/m.11415 type:complete len:84 (-) Transcript_5147:89-340(-)
MGRQGKQEENQKEVQEDVEEAQGLRVLPRNMRERGQSRRLRLSNAATPLRATNERAAALAAAPDGLSPPSDQTQTTQISGSYY